METSNYWIKFDNKGKMIYCPHCDKPSYILNFAWDTLQCADCYKFVSKSDWKVKEA